MAFTIKTTTAVPTIAKGAAASRPDHEFPWDAMASTALKGEEVPTISVDAGYWAGRGEKLQDLKASELRSRIRNNFNQWQKRPESPKDVALFIASGEGLTLDCYVQKVEASSAAAE